MNQRFVSVLYSSATNISLCNSPKEDGLLGVGREASSPAERLRSNINKKKDVWNFLVAQWLRPCAPNAGAWDPSLSGELGPTVLQLGVHLATVKAAVCHNQD